MTTEPTYTLAWQPKIPVTELAAVCLEKAARRRAALAPVLRAAAPHTSIAALTCRARRACLQLYPEERQDASGVLCNLHAGCLRQVARAQSCSRPLPGCFLSQLQREHLGKKVTTLHGPKCTRDWSAMPASVQAQSDDCMLPVYFWVPAEDGSCKLLRGQFLPWIDTRTTYLHCFQLLPSESYGSLDIVRGVVRLHDEFGLPPELYFERGIWQRSLVITGRGDEVPWKQRVYGLRDLGVRLSHALDPSAKVVERVLGALQNRMERERGYCGRDERRDCPAAVAKAKRAVEAGRCHPGEWFYSHAEWVARLNALCDAYNDEPQGGNRSLHLNPLPPDEESLALLRSTRRRGSLPAGPERPGSLPALLVPARRKAWAAGRTFYTHVSDQYAPFSTKVINVGVRDSTYVLDGLLYHESDLRIEEHYTDTAGFTDHVFAMMHLLGFRFAPRIRDLADTMLYVPKSERSMPALAPLIGGSLNLKSIRVHWNDILRLATSIKQGTVTTSLMLRKLGSYPRQNGLAVALRELGRIERTLFILDWLQSVELRRRVHAGLNKGEARNALARAVFFYRLGELRDRSFEQQRYRASGLNLVTAAIVLWNTVYLERAARALQRRNLAWDEGLLRHLSPLGWEHINLTGDYVWRQNRTGSPGKFRPLRVPPGA